MKRSLSVSAMKISMKKEKETQIACIKHCRRTTTATLSVCYKVFLWDKKEGSADTPTFHADKRIININIVRAREMVLMLKSN